MGLEDAARFGNAITLITLAWPAFALLLAWSRGAPAAPLRWGVAAVMAALAFTIHFQMALGAYAASERAVALLGLGLCVAVAARLGAVTTGIGQRWPLLASPVGRALALLVLWSLLAVGTSTAASA